MDSKVLQLWQQPETLRICAARRAARRRSRRRSERCDNEKRARARRRPADASRPEAGLDRPRSRPPEGEHEERPNFRKENSEQGSSMCVSALRLDHNIEG